MGIHGQKSYENIITSERDLCPDKGRCQNYPQTAAEIDRFL